MDFWKIGCRNQWTGNNSPALDFIEFSAKTSDRIIDQVLDLYRRGCSISDIAEQTGLKRTSIWSSLRSGRQRLRSDAPVPFDRWRKGHGKSRARPPFGFCYFQGAVIRDPKEYPVLQLIRNLARQGESISGIQRHLDGKRIRTRTGKPWSYNVIKAILARFADGTIKALEAALKEKTEVEDGN